MKRFRVCATVVACIMLGACGSVKRTAGVDTQRQSMQPTMTLRAEEPCIALAREKTGNLRAYGTATSFVEKIALNEAERDARNRLATMIKIATEGAAQDYAQNAIQNQKKSAGTIGESIMTQFVAEEIQNTRILKTSIYDLSDGSIQVYVCIEMQSDKNNFSQNLKNVLDREGIIELQYDRDRFINKMNEGLEEYKEKHMQE